MGEVIFYELQHMNYKISLTVRIQYVSVMQTVNYDTQKVQILGNYVRQSIIIATVTALSEPMCIRDVQYSKLRSRLRKEFVKLNKSAADQESIFFTKRL